MTTLDYRKEFRGSVLDLEYFHSNQPVKRRSLIKNIKEVNKIKKTESEVEDRNIIISLSTIVSENIQIRYFFEKTLGEGAFGKVKIASLRENRKKKFAIKSIPRDMLEKSFS